MKRTWTSAGNNEDEGDTKFIKDHPLGTVNIQTKFHLFFSCQAVLNRHIDQQTAGRGT